VEESGYVSIFASATTVLSKDAICQSGYLAGMGLSPGKMKGLERVLMKQCSWKTILLSFLVATQEVFRSFIG